MADLLDQIDSLDPKNSDMAEALAFLRLVVKNNPKKTAAEIAARSDVQEALALFTDWAEKAKKVVDLVVTDVPKKVATEIVEQAAETIDGIVADSQVDDKNVTKWREDREPENWAARIILRITWFVEWLRGLANTFLLKGPYKTWVSRLAPNTCKFCRALHGVTIPIHASFAPAAIDAGYPAKYVYGGLYSPGLHPHCQCRCVSAKAPKSG